MTLPQNIITATLLLLFESVRGIALIDVCFPNIGEVVRRTLTMSITGHQLFPIPEAT